MQMVDDDDDFHGSCSPDERTDTQHGFFSLCDVSITEEQGVVNAVKKVSQRNFSNGDFGIDVR